jgi:hypothetical protein
MQLPKELMDRNGRLNIDMYHGTSTLFLDSIVENGLAGIDPVRNWNLLELSKEVYDLSAENLKGTDFFEIRKYSFQKMVEQSNEGYFNFTHGGTYLSPSSFTAAKYAIDKRYGSELLTYTLELLNELIKLDITYVKQDLFPRFSEIFNFMDLQPSPLLIKVSKPYKSNLLDEKGNEPTKNFNQLSKILDEKPEIFDDLTQQTNFMLTQQVKSENLKFWLINIKEWNQFVPKYNLYSIKVR